jgi:hypothetical protein
VNTVALFCHAGELLIEFNCSLLSILNGNKHPSWIEPPVHYNTNPKTLAEQHKFLSYSIYCDDTQECHFYTATSSPPYCEHFTAAVQDLLSSLLCFCLLHLAVIVNTPLPTFQCYIAVPGTIKNVRVDPQEVCAKWTLCNAPQVSSLEVKSQAICLQGIIVRPSQWAHGTQNVSRHKTASFQYSAEMASEWEQPM